MFLKSLCGFAGESRILFISEIILKKGMENLSVVAVGTFCCDEIRRMGSKPDTGLGGIFYTLITLGQLFNGNGEIYPRCKIGEVDYTNITGQLARYRTIKLDLLSRHPGRNNTVLLNYYSRDERKEFSTNLPPPYTISELLPIPDVRMILVNFISGIEMGFRTFRALRKRVNIPVYVDLHSLFLGFKKNGERYYRKNHDWSRWHISGDFIQMNEIEASILAGHELKKTDDLKEFGKHLLHRGAEAVIVTRGRKGSLVVWKSGNRSFHKNIPAYLTGDSSDPTGCGDVFSAAFVYSNLQGGEPPEAADFASKTAGVRASCTSRAELHDLNSKLKELKVL